MKSPDSFRHPVRLPSLLAAFGALMAVGFPMLAIARQAARPPRTTEAGKTQSKTTAAPASVRLAYQLKPGDSRRYRVDAFFNGHVPPFALPESPPIHLRVELVYTATVQKQNEKGAEVLFNVEQADISLLEKDPGPNGKLDPENVTPFPLPLSQVQKALNVTATLRPDGSVAEVKGAEESPVRIELGFDLRKLFLLLLPVTFPDKALHVNDEWAFQDGLLGSNPGKVTYKGRLRDIRAEGKALAFRVDKSAQAVIEDRKDKDGKPAEKPEDAMETTTGKVTLTGEMQFVAPATADKAPSGEPRCAGRLRKANLKLTADIDRKRTVTAEANPPDAPPATTIEETKIDLQARLSVQEEKAPARATASTSGKAAPK